MKKTIITLSIVFTVLISASLGYALGYGSNMVRYDDFYMTKPTTPYDKSNEYLVNDYLNDVKIYIENVERYIENCNNDLITIQNARARAEEDAQRIINEYNYFISSLKYRY